MLNSSAWMRSTCAASPVKRGRDWESGLLNCLADPFGSNEGWDRPWSISDFKLEKKLHTAKASSVYTAKEAATGTPVIIKCYYKEKLSPLNKGQVDRERRIHAALRHPNIVRLFTSFEDETNIYLVMEQATQGDLFMKMCAATQHFSERTIVAEFLQPLLLSLDQLHTLGILHRDIKPENLLVCGDGTLKLADFGLAVDRREERPITRAGTLDYMAPEVLLCPDKTRPEQNKHLAELEYGTAVDVWAVGILAFELLVGRAPFACDTPRETYDSILTADPEIPGHLPHGAKQFLAATLAKDPRERPLVQDLLQHPWVQQFAPAPERCAASTRQAAGAGSGAARLLNKSFSYDHQSFTHRYGHGDAQPTGLVGEMSALSCDVLELRSSHQGSMSAAVAKHMQPSAVSASAAQPAPVLRARPHAPPGRPLSRSGVRGRMGDSAASLLSASSSQSGFLCSQSSLLVSLGSNGLPQLQQHQQQQHQQYQQQQQHHHAMAQTQPVGSSARMVMAEPSTSGRGLGPEASSTMPRASVPMLTRAAAAAAAAQQAQQAPSGGGLMSRPQRFLSSLKIFASPSKGGDTAAPAPAPAAPRCSPFSLQPIQDARASLPPLEQDSSSHSFATAASLSRWPSEFGEVPDAPPLRRRVDDQDRSVRSLASEFASASSLVFDDSVRASLQAQGSAHSLYADANYSKPSHVQDWDIEYHAHAQNATAPQAGMFVAHAPTPPVAAASPASKLGGRARALLARLSSRRIPSAAHYGEEAM